MSYKQALRAVENCACAWDIFDVSVRDLSLSESIAERSKQKSDPPPMPWAENPGLIYQPAERNQAQTRQGYEQVRAANQFAYVAQKLAQSTP